MQRMFNVDKWTVVDEGHSLAFLNDKPRNVRLDVNSPSEVALYYVDQPTGEIFFLALVKGRDVVEFGTIGPFEITVRGGSVNIFTNDGDDISMQATDPEAYVKVMERRHRNPELEHMQFVMNQNMERNLAQQAHEFERLLERRLEAMAAAEAVRTSAASNASPQPAPTGTTGTAAAGTGTNETGAENSEPASGTTPAG